MQLDNLSENINNFTLIMPTRYNISSTEGLDIYEKTKHIREIIIGFY